MNVSDARQAAKKATEYLRDLQTEPEMVDLRVEEIEISEDESEWWITVSYLRPGGEEETRPELTRPILLGFDRERAYKRVGLRSDDGSLIGLKIREMTVG